MSEIPSQRNIFDSNNIELMVLYANVLKTLNVKSINSFYTKSVLSVYDTKVLYLGSVYFSQHSNSIDMEIDFFDENNADFYFLSSLKYGVGASVEYEHDLEKKNILFSRYTPVGVQHQFFIGFKIELN